MFSIPTFEVVVVTGERPSHVSLHDPRREVANLHGNRRPGFVADVVLDEAAVMRLLHGLWNPAYAVDEAAI